MFVRLFVFQVPYPVVTDSSVVELKSIYSKPKSVKIENKVLSRVQSKKTADPVPSPVFRPAGSVTRVGKATKGERTLQALTVRNLKTKIGNIKLAYRTATAESRNQAVKDLLELTKELMSDVDFKGNDALSRAFRTAAKTFNHVNKYRDVLSLGLNLIDLGEGMIRLKTANNLTERDLRNLTDKLLLKYRDLSNELDDAINDPDVQDWLSNKSKTDC